MEYDEPLFRPPSEADSLILQVTLGCSHNRCTFCSMYRTKRFRVQPDHVVDAAIDEARDALGPHVRRVFLADGDALCLSTSRLVRILDRVHGAFPRLARVSCYANARDVLRKDDDELADLRRRGLRLLYVGLESGDDETLARVEKGATADEVVLAVRRARACGLAVSVMVLVGIGGRERSLVHARASADAVNRMQPDYTALLTYIPVPGSPLHGEIARGAFALPGRAESLREVREFLAHVDAPTHFSCNHASNHLPLTGRLPAMRARMLELVDGALRGEVALRPERLRGL